MDQKSYQKIVNSTLRWLDLQHIKVGVTIRSDIDRGRGYYDTKEVQLPAWLEECDPHYRIYYVVHELTHCLLGYRHDKPFKRVEDVLLGLWDIAIERKKVYPKRLFHDGKEVLNIPHQTKLLRSVINETCKRNEEQKENQPDNTTGQ